MLNFSMNRGKEKPTSNQRRNVALDAAGAKSYNSGTDDPAWHSASMSQRRGDPVQRSSGDVGFSLLRIAN
jgi:hypothetical protein